MPNARRWLLIAVFSALALAGCPGSLEDPDRFGEPDAAAGGSGGKSDAGTGGDV